MVAPIDTDDFKAYFDRDFSFGTAKSSVRDSDIARAIAEANALFNAGLFVPGEGLEIAFEFLTAHCLAMNMVAAGGVDKVGGGLGSSGTFPVSNKSAGPLSVGYQIPQDLANDPILHQFMNTKYGQRYLELLAPNLVGNVATVLGATTP